MRLAPLVYIVAMLGAAGCAAAAREASGSRIAHVYVTVDAWDDARVEAWVRSRSGQRTGWYKSRMVREIPGCVHEFGSEEGLPEGPDEDSTSSTAPAREYRIPEETGVTPKYHHFTVEDSAGAPSLIRQGGCELGLDPVVAGKVHLILIADGVGLKGCKDTTSVWVKPGAPSRWWLSWKATGDTCVVKITRVEAGR